MRPTYAEIDLGAVAHNVAALNALIGDSQLCAVVKADAYGHGDAPIATAAVDAGASWLAVAMIEEGIRLREAGIGAPILLLSESLPDDVSHIVKWELTPTAYSLGLVEALAATGAPLRVHLKIDTGMHRVGAPPPAAKDLIDAVRGRSNLTLGGLWTHFPAADEDPDFTRRQIEVFDRTLRGVDVPMVHMANTAAAVLFPESRRDMARIGLGVYGLHPCRRTRSRVDLRPAMRLVTHVSRVQRLEPGARPSYGRIKELAESSTVATAPAGYADGVPRGISRRGCALVGGRRRPLAGMVTMDQVVINMGDAEASAGDEVVLLGRQGDEEISADEWAEELGTISYEVVCSISHRVPRRYMS